MTPHVSEALGPREVADDVSALPLSRRDAAIGGGALVITLLLGMIASWVLPAYRPWVDSVAVLPFENRSGNEDLDYLSTGVAARLIDELSTVLDLKVIGRHSAFDFRGRSSDLRAIGRALGVRTVILGTFTQTADSLVIGAELRDVHDGRRLWAERFSGMPDDLGALQAQLQAALSRQLRGNVRANVGSSRDIPHAEAHRLYLKGRERLLHSPDAADAAIDLFQKAIAHNPSDAVVWTGLAQAYIRQAWLADVDRGRLAGAARAAVERAVELDPTLADAHSARGTIQLYFDWDWRAAETSMQRGMQLASGSATTHQTYGEMLLLSGRYDEALAASHQAIQLDPLAPAAIHDVAIVHMARHELEHAATYFKRASDVDPMFISGRVKLANIYARMGRCADALATTASAERVASTRSHTLARAWIAFTYARCGERDRARRLLESFERRGATGDASATELALLHLAVGDQDEGIGWLERAYQDRSPELVYLPIHAQLLLGTDADPRISDIVRRVNGR